MIAVMLIEDGFLVESELDDFEARADDAFWRRFARASRGSWHDFTQWWIARRWVVPRNPSRR